MRPTPIECIHYCTQAKVIELEYMFNIFKVQGLLMESDIRMLASFGIPIFGMFSDYYNCELSDVMSMSRDFVITNDDFEAVITKLTSPGGLMYLENKPRFA